MLINFEQIRDEVLISYIKNGNISMKKYSVENIHAWESTTERDYTRDDKFKNYNKEPVRKKRSNRFNKFTQAEFLYNLPKEDQEEIFSFEPPNIHFFDIETRFDKSAPRNVDQYVKEANYEVNCISVVNPDFTAQFLSWLPIKDKEGIKTRVNDYVKQKFDYSYEIEYLLFKDEHEMLTYFFNEIVTKIPVLTGWNCLSFDWSYLTNRAINLEIDISVCSPTGKIDVRNFNSPVHRAVLDYLEFVKKWDRKIKIKENFTLDYIAEAATGLRKIHYDGNLNDLFYSDFDHYGFYNIVDSILVHLIHLKLKTVNIALSLSALCRIPLFKNGSAVVVTETTLYNKLLENHLVVSDEILNRENIERLYILNEESYEKLFKKIEDLHVYRKILELRDIVFRTETEFQEEVSQILTDKDFKRWYPIILKECAEKYGGAFVKDPIIGKYRWVACFDFASLYPTTMRQFNISIESLIDKIHRRRVRERRKNCKANGEIICANGSVFYTDDSILRMIITDLYARRKVEKKRMMEYKEKADKIKHVMEKIEKKILQLETVGV